MLHDKITIMTSNIPDAGRSNGLLRFIDYHARLGVRLVIGVEALDAPAWLDDWPNLDAVTFKKDENVYRKLQILASKIKTPYIAWVADDDFITSEMLVKSCETLDKHEEVAACDGLNLFFSEKQVRRVNHLYSFAQYKDLKHSVGSDIAMRLVRHANYFNPMVIHGVMRKQVFEAVFDGLQTLPVKWFDNLAVARILMRGQIAMLPVVSNIRSADTRIMDRTPSFYPGADIDKLGILMDQVYKPKIYEESSGFTEMTPLLKAALDYYFAATSGALTLVGALPRKQSLALLKLKSILALFALQLRHPGIYRDIAKIKQLMIKHPIC